MSDERPNERQEVGVMRPSSRGLQAGDVMLRFLLRLHWVSVSVSVGEILQDGSVSVVDELKYSLAAANTSSTLWSYATFRA
ncbi:hypothetical protein EYF80_039663 [Liparis tanakae]|uniref:Uncharacterized protein n=1 Tax=Liparis tanakae TaxID=230148 RepID=A0A4Z2G9B9_9TELE|nr:hypothetical protein EYF80_039663 [Liparis tanakae]